MIGCEEAERGGRTESAEAGGDAIAVTIMWLPPAPALRRLGQGTLQIVRQPCQLDHRGRDSGFTVSNAAEICTEKGRSEASTGEVRDDHAWRASFQICLRNLGWFSRRPTGAPDLIRQHLRPQSTLSERSGCKRVLAILRLASLRSVGPRSGPRPAWECGQ
jgi:hypothetical protein